MKKDVNSSNLITVGTVIILMLALIIALFVIKPQAQESVTDAVKRTNEQAVNNFLVLGRDAAAGLCDVIMLASVNTNSGDVNIMQIPRDTYFDCSASTYKKVNGAYNSLGSAEAFSQSLSEALGIRIDYYLSLDLSVVAKMIDAVDGIEVNVPLNMDYEDPAQNLFIYLKAGKQKLDGKRAVEFLRYRSGYVTGDLGRIDAQKLFLNAFAKRLVEIGNPLSLFNVFKLICNNGETNIKEQDLLSIGLKCAKTKGGRIFYMTAPGEAIQSNVSGVWYYILSKQSMVKLLNERFLMQESFDKQNKFVDKNVKSFYDIYNKFCDIRIYTADEIENNEININ